MQGLTALVEKGQLWSRRVGGPARFAAVTAALVGLLVLATLGRLGTDVARNLALGFASVGVATALWLAVRALRTSRQPVALVRRMISPWDRALGAKILRALQLSEAAALVPSRTGSASPPEKMSAELSSLHLVRMVERATAADILRHAERRALRYQWLGGGLAVAFLVTNLLRPRELAEGFNLLITPGRNAPIAMHWIERLVISARAPGYLRLSERRVLSGGRTQVPVGTRLTLRALPLHDDRQLVITDGEREVPLVSDGSGGLVAHYTIEKNADLRVAARFGDRLILEQRATQLLVRADSAPVVHLEGAPRTQSLADVQRLPLRWSIEDDHGLKQIDLVLESGSRTERRTLAHFDGETRRHDGGYLLRADDEFLRSLFLPAVIRIEARDNDGFSGSKWGRSEPIVVVPTAVGEPEALRYSALTTARDQFVGALATGELESTTLKYEGQLREASVALVSALSRSYRGLEVPPGLQAFVAGRLRAVTEARGRGALASEAQLQRLERLVLSVDSALSQMVERDARGVSKQLAEVADEAHGRLLWVAEQESPSAALEPLSAALYALESGAQQLIRLGRVGNDIGSVARADLFRIEGSVERGDWFHAALAAHHLAERLRRATSSFGSKGSGSSGGGVEAGNAGGKPLPDAQSGAQGEGQPEPTASFDRLARQIAELARQHAGAIQVVDQALSGASAPAEGERELQAEAIRRASELRDGVELLPLPGHLPGTVRAVASLAREHSRAMSHGLEALALRQAFKSGASARAAFEKAMAETRVGGGLYRELSSASKTLRDTMAWVETRLRERRLSARKRARRQLSSSAAMERELSKIAGELAQLGQLEGSSLPREVITRLEQARAQMQRATEAFGTGEGEQGLGWQRRAQRLLEQADRGQTSDPSGRADEQGIEEPDPDSDQDVVPEGESNDRASAFRRRVLENLGSVEGGRLAPAIQRYAEGLLN